VEKGWIASSPAAPPIDASTSAVVDVQEAFHAVRKGVLVIKDAKDFWAGIIFMAFGVSALVVGWNYSLGTVSRMGPGYFPRMLGILLLLVGAASVIRSFVAARVELPSFALKPALLIIGSLVVSGYLMTRAGLIVALCVLMLGAGAASEKFRTEWKKMLLLTAATIVFCVVVFVRLLGISLPLVGSWFW
jgi:hypothetical protein